MRTKKLTALVLMLAAACSKPVPEQRCVAWEDDPAKTQKVVAALQQQALPYEFDGRVICVKQDDRKRFYEIIDSALGSSR